MCCAVLRCAGLQADALAKAKAKSAATLSRIDESFGLSKSKNAEIRHAWLMVCTGSFSILHD